MTTFDMMARRAIIESNLYEYDITPDWIMEAWMKPRYREVIDELAFSNLNKTIDAPFVTAPVISIEPTMTEGDEVVSFAGASPDYVGRFVRAGTDNEWYQLVAYLDATHMRMDTPYANHTKTVGAKLAKRYYTIPWNVRWLFDVKLPRRAFMLYEVSASKMDEMWPNRNWAPSVPQWWSPYGWDEEGGQRIIEIYPPGDQAYRLEATGYAGVTEPVLDASPHRDISDRILIEGVLSDAFRFRASKVPHGASTSDGREAITAVRSLLDVAKSHELRWLELLERQRKRDNIDAPSPRIRLAIQRRDSYGRGLYDPIMTAEDEIWNRSPSVGEI